MEKGLFFGLLILLVSCANNKSSVELSELNDTTAIYFACSGYLTEIDNTHQIPNSLELKERISIEDIGNKTATQKGANPDSEKVGRFAKLESITIGTEKACSLIYDKKSQRSIGFKLEKIGNEWVVIDISKLSEIRL